jgi:hypothetical protein
MNRARAVVLVAVASLFGVGLTMPPPELRVVRLVSKPALQLPCTKRGVEEMVRTCTARKRMELIK